MVGRDWQKALEKKRLEGSCRVCDSKGSLEAAHVIPRSLGGDQDREATIPLCRDCHRAYDAHQLDLLPYLTLEEQAHAVSILGLARAWRSITGQPIP